MRVLICIDSLTFGGAEKQALLLVRGLLDSGHAVSVVTLSSHVPRLKSLDGYSFDSLILNKKNGLDSSTIRRLRRHIVEWKPDVVHSFLFQSDIYTRIAGCLSGVPIINSERSSNYKLSPKRTLLHYGTCFGTDAVIANTFMGAAFSRKRYPLRAGNVHTIWNGIDFEEIAAHKKDQSLLAEYEFAFKPGKVVCLVGNIKPAKDIGYALDVVRSLNEIDHEWKLVIVGGVLPYPYDSYYEKIKPDLMDLESKGIVHHLGAQDDVLSFLKAADVFILTSKYEGFPNAAMEAMAVGCPVVSTDVSDLGKILPFDWQVVGNRSSDEFAAAIVMAFARSNELAPKQYAFLKEHCSLTALVGKTLGVYELYT